MSKLLLPDLSIWNDSWRSWDGYAQMRTSSTTFFEVAPGQSHLNHGYRCRMSAE